jgi:hypothetical protein
MRNVTFEKHLREVVGGVIVLCTCQQRDVPFEYGCSLCEGDGTRLVEVRRDGMVRISRGVYPPSDWRSP